MIKKSVLALALAGLLSSPAYADVTINGFASIKAGMTTGSNDTLYGYADDLDFKNESLMALQVRSDLGEKLSVTAQLMGRGNNDFDIGFEWAFLTYELTDNMRINAGRLRTPFYKYSDYMDVGYAYDWSRVPQSVYSLGFDNIEGISLYRTAQLGSFDSTLQLIFGAYSGNISLAGSAASAKIDNIAGITWELGQDWFNLRAAYLSGKVTIDAPALQPLLGGLQQVGLPQVATSVDFADDKGVFIGLGATIDRNNLIAVFEFNKVDVEDTFFAERENYYLSVGYRFDTITPYVSFEREEHSSKAEIYQPLTTALPPQLLLPLIGTVESLAFEADTFNIGMRYDFHPSAAFKAQFSSQKDKIQNDRSGLITVGVDLVF